MIWELLFMLVVLKIPIVYLCAVVWWAIRAEPAPPEPASALVVAERNPWTPPALRPNRRRGGPHGRPARGPRGGRRERAPAEARR